MHLLFARDLESFSFFLDLYNTLDLDAQGRFKLRRYFKELSSYSESTLKLPSDKLIKLLKMLNFPSKEKFVFISGVKALVDYIGEEETSLDLLGHAISEKYVAYHNFLRVMGKIFVARDRKAWKAEKEATVKIQSWARALHARATVGRMQEDARKLLEKKRQEEIAKEKAAAAAAAKEKMRLDAIAREEQRVAATKIQHEFNTNRVSVESSVVLNSC